MKPPKIIGSYCLVGEPTGIAILASFDTDRVAVSAAAMPLRMETDTAAIAIKLYFMRPFFSSFACPARGQQQGPTVDWSQSTTWGADALGDALRSIRSTST